MVLQELKKRKTVAHRRHNPTEYEHCGEKECVDISHTQTHKDVLIMNS